MLGVALEVDHPRRPFPSACEPYTLGSSMLRSILLKAVATGITLLTAATSAGYVSSHLKHSSAPLHPAVGGSVASSQTGGRLSLSGSVHSANVETVTSTYAS